MKWFMENAAAEVFALVFGGFLVGMIGNIRHRRERARILAKIMDGGDDTERIYCQLNMLFWPASGNGAPTLKLFNLPGRTTVGDLFKTNAALRDYVVELSTKTTAANPVLGFRGEIGKTSLHEIFNHFACSLGALSFEIRHWLFVVTCKDAGTFEGKRIRCFLISPADLMRFEDWDFCQTIRVCYKDHAARIAELHKIAKLYNAIRRLDKDPRSPTLIMDMMAAVPTVLPEQESRVIDWASPDRQALMREAGIGEDKSCKPAAEAQDGKTSKAPATANA